MQAGSETAQAASRVREMETADVRLWKKELEFSNSMETAWQLVIVVLARKASKKVGQLLVVKFLPKSVSNGRGMIHGGAVGEGVGVLVVVVALDAIVDLVDLCMRLNILCGRVSRCS